MEQGALPANNIAQKLFNSQLSNCVKPYGFGSSWQPSECCAANNKLQNFYEKTPVKLWNTKGNGQGGPPFDACTEDAFLKQCMLSQHFTYLSKNNTLPR